MFHPEARSARIATLVAAFVLPSLAQAQFTPDWSASVMTHVPGPAMAVDAGRNSVLVATQSGLPATVHKPAAIRRAPWWPSWMRPATRCGRRP